MPRRWLCLLLLCSAVLGCRSREERVAAAIQALATDDADAVAAAQKQLQDLGSAATVPALGRALTHADVRVRRAASQVLWGFGAAAEPAAPSLAVALGDPDPEVRLSAAMGLHAIGPGARPAVPALILALGDSDGNVRLWCVKALGAIGRDARQAVPALERASRHDSLRQAAEQAIQRIQAP